MIRQVTDGFGKIHGTFSAVSPAFADFHRGSSHLTCLTDQLHFRFRIFCKSVDSHNGRTLPHVLHMVDMTHQVAHALCQSIQVFRL